MQTVFKVNLFWKNGNYYYMQERYVVAETEDEAREKIAKYNENLKLIGAEPFVSDCGYWVESDVVII